MYDYNKLYPKFEELFIELLCILHGKVPRSLMEDIEYFIMEPHMSPTCVTNTSLAFRIGHEVATIRGANSFGICALWTLFLARDGMLKGFPPSAVDDLLRDSREAVKCYKLYETVKLNYEQ